MYNKLCRALLRNATTIRTTTNLNNCSKIVNCADKHIQSNFLLVDNIQTRKMSGTEAPSTSSAVVPKHTNRLINEKSPYLLQHAHNPVDWYSWCDEAIERARKENKLIFLSVGYSTCHWCHVMEHESFENEEVAAIMNEHYINIKVDREERPDIDKIYMHIVVMLNDSGGWPMSVWLTPDLAPVTAGTYFPPTNRYGMPAFRTILLSIANKWKADEQKLRNTGLKVVDLMRKNIDANQPATSEQAQAHDLGVESKLTDALQIYKRRFDSINGGFGFSPKFPEAPRLNLLFHAYLANKQLDVLQMALTTLEKIAEGGIHDHIGGGFSRYAVDALWHVPHFEKMLYDQAQLMSAYAISYKLTGDNKFLVAAQGIYSYLLRDLRHELGGFYAGEDADSLPDWQSKTKVEGAFYVWQLKQITDVMQENAALYAELKLTIDEIAKIYAGYYNIESAGNVDPANDPHEHFSHKNILIIRESMSDICEKYQITAAQLQQIIEITNQLLLKVRAERPRPHLDNKIICSWNALMLIGLCDLATCDTDKQAEYAETARQLYEFMRQHFYNEQQQTLIHACYGEVDSKSGLSVGQRIEGFLDDYVFLINACLNYYKLTLDQQVLQWARQLQETQQRLFWDNDKGGYFYSQAQAKSLVLRLKDAEDGAEPSGNSLATRNLLVLSHYFDDKTMSHHAKKTFQCFSNNSPFGYIMPQMMAALLLLDQGIDMVAVVGSDAQSKQAYFHILRKYFVPGLVIFNLDPTQQDTCIENFANLQHKYKMVDDKTTVYICHHRVCHMPITETAQLEKVLQTNYFVPKSA